MMKNLVREGKVINKLKGLQMIEKKRIETRAGEINRDERGKKETFLGPYPVLRSSNHLDPTLTHGPSIQ